MNNVKLLEKMNALMQLQDEKDATCKVYTNCSACPNLLSGGYCEIKLAISRIKYDINSIYKQETMKKVEGGN